MAVERHFNTGDIEAVISRLRDVIAVSVVADAIGNVTEVHVLAGPSRSPKQVVRDVESALMARLGIAVDHKKISVAQVEGGSSQWDHSRLKFSDASISLNGSTTEATVRLSKEGAVFSGTESGLSSSSAQMKLVAAATLKAIEDSSLTNARMVLEDACDATVGGRKVAVVLVNMVTDRGEEFLTGSALIKQDIWKAVVNATLDAVNRRLHLAQDR